MERRGLGRQGSDQDQTGHLGSICPRGIASGDQGQHFKIRPAIGFGYFGLATLVERNAGLARNLRPPVFNFGLSILVPVFNWALCNLREAPPDLFVMPIFLPATRALI
jgi:hypothetical protein